MSFDILQEMIYAFDGYMLFFALLICIYGLLVDIRWSKDKGTNRDAKLAKRIYISCITVSTVLFVIPRLM